MTTKGSSTGDERNCPSVVGYNEEGQIRCNLCEKIFESMKSMYLHLKGTDHDVSDWKRFFKTHTKGSSSGETVGSTSKELKWGRKKRRSFPSQLQPYDGAPNVRGPDIVELPEAVARVDQPDQLRLDPRGVPNVRGPDIVELPEAVARVNRADQIRLDPCVIPNVRDGLRLRERDDVDSPRSGKRVCRPAGFQSDRRGGAVDMRAYFRFDPNYEEVLETAETLLLLSTSEPKKSEDEEVVEGCQCRDMNDWCQADVPPTAEEEEEEAEDELKKWSKVVNVGI